MAPAAPVHVRAVHGRSAFFVLINLPAGRKATLAYLEKLGAFPNALMPQPADRNAKFLAKNLPRFNPELPQFPVGTQVALVRELLAVDDQGKIKPTRLIESVQFRVYREVPKGDPAHPEGFDDLVGKQDFYEFRITRKDLFAGIAGGLHAVGPRDEEVLPLLNPHADDPFEEDPPIRPGTFRTLAQCSGCHSRPGIHSVEAYRRSFVQLPQPAHLRGRPRPTGTGRDAPEVGALQLGSVARIDGEGIDRAEPAAAADGGRDSVSRSSTVQCARPPPAGHDSVTGTSRSDQSV